MRRVLAVGLVCLIALAAWPAGAIEKRTARVVIEAPDRLESKVDRLAAIADERLAGIEGDLVGLPRVGVVEVRLVVRAEDLPSVAPPGRGAPPWAVGVAYPDEGVVSVAARARDGTLVDMEQTLAHELAHMALERALGEGRVPRWLNEGFAFQHSTDASMARATTLAGALIGGKLIPIEDLDASFPQREDRVSLAYAQSYDFVGFLARRGRWQDSDDDGDRAAFHQFLAEIAEGASPDGAARAAFGRTLAQLEEEWKEDLRERYLWLPGGIGLGILWGLGGVLLVLAWRRRRRLARLKLSQWEIEEALDDSRAATRRGELN